MDESTQAPARPTVEVQRRLTMTDHTLDDIDLKKHCPLGPEDAVDFVSRVGAGLGQLSKLPNETLTEILLDLDIRSLLRFKQVNSSAIHFVDTLPQYSLLRRCYSDILRAAIGTQASFSCRTLYATLATSECASTTCSRAGQYLYLITCKRVCYSCFTGDPYFRPISSGLARQFSTLPVKTLKQRLPFIYSIPGRYGGSSREGRACPTKKVLFDHEAVQQACPGPASVPATRVPLAGPWMSHTTFYDPLRFMSIITAPYLDQSSRDVDRGFHCRTCNRADRHSLLDFRTHYTAKGISDHIDQHHPGAVMQVQPDRDKARPWIILE